LRKRFEAGQYQAVIDKVYSMKEVVAAHTYVDTGRKKGNVILQISKVEA
jgi:NADPH:quinone reductase-like Zn-dependent oxidoreductase